MRFRGDGIGHLDPRTRNTRGLHVDESERTRNAQLDVAEAESVALQEANASHTASGGTGGDPGDESSGSSKSGSESETEDESGSESGGSDESADEFERGGVDDVFLDV